MSELETAGDTAASRHFHEDAVIHYERALKTAEATSRDVARISEKLGDALWNSSDPSTAKVHFERALVSYGGAVQVSEKACRILLRSGSQFWVESKTKARIPLYEHTVSAARMVGDANVRRDAGVSMANTLSLLGRHAEAESYLEQIRHLERRRGDEIRARYENQRAICAAARGDQQVAFSHFRRATSVAKACGSSYHATVLWDDYALWALALGDSKTALECSERALDTARRQHISWRIPYLSLRYAHLLFRLGRHDFAHELLRDAITYDPAAAPVIRVTFTALGLPLAIRYRDKAALQRCFYEDAFRLALVSGEPARIAGVATALSLRLSNQHRSREIPRFLKRALAEVPDADLCWDFCIDVARFGYTSDFSRARVLLAKRSELPKGDVARAFLLLFDATTSLRYARPHDASRLASRAKQAFEKLGWLTYVESCQGLLAKDARATGEPDSTKAVEDLTRREREIAELALEGLTNRAIATRLQITENTVESHMSAVLTRLDVHSRWQLQDVLGKHREPRIP